MPSLPPSWALLRPTQYMLTSVLCHEFLRLQFDFLLGEIELLHTQQPDLYWLHFIILMSLFLPLVSVYLYWTLAINVKHWIEDPLTGLWLWLYVTFSLSWLTAQGLFPYHPCSAVSTYGLTLDHCHTHSLFLSLFKKVKEKEREFRSLKKMYSFDGKSDKMLS